MYPFLLLVKSKCSSLSWWQEICESVIELNQLIKRVLDVVLDWVLGRKLCWNKSVILVNVSEHMLSADKL